MNGRRLARWAARATVIGALLVGTVYVAATSASAGAIWNLVPSTPPAAPAAPAGSVTP